MSLRPKIALYFDVVSPWSRIAYTVLRRYKQPWNFDLQLKPINLGYVMKFSENRPPITVPNKGRWMDEDMQRASVFYGVTLNRPSVFPVNTFFAQSLLRLISLEVPEELEAAIDALYEAVWTRDENVEDAQVLQKILADDGILGDDSKRKEFVEKAFSKEAKSALAQESKDLVENGCFGAPWIVATRPSDGQVSRFFGSDRFEILAAHLQLPYLGPLANGSTPKL